MAVHSKQETHLIIKGMVESKFLSLTPKIYSVFYLIWTQPHCSPVTELRLCSVWGIGFGQILCEKRAVLTWTQAV
ncbi:rCG37851, isoform CRA_b [Rattus norvegicus]|uniref:RCG37851, isoform CRA_b n=1 Tax=Rattus norvegicus TaxID=10116 RepID=A6K654_RAT|nr:rCG37851, isoform CRA_b [Rattus norvegicus]